MGEGFWPVFACGSMLLSLCCPEFGGSWGWGRVDLSGWSLPGLSLALSPLAGSQGPQTCGGYCLALFDAARFCTHSSDLRLRAVYF